MTRARSVLRAVLPMLGLALLAGWAMHRDHPEGIHLKTPLSACDPTVHGFATMYAVMLGVGIGLALVVAMGVLVGSQLGIVGRAREGLRSAAITSVWVAVALGAALPGKYLIETFLPLTPRAACSPASG